MNIGIIGSADVTRTRHRLQAVLAMIAVMLRLNDITQAWSSCVRDR